MSDEWSLKDKSEFIELYSTLYYEYDIIETLRKKLIEDIKDMESIIKVGFADEMIDNINKRFGVE